MEGNGTTKAPSAKSLLHAFQISVVDDRPVMFDYWNDSVNKECFIGVKEDQEKLLVKSEDEYTSTIAKIFKVEDEYIILTENSLYVVSAEIPTRRVS